VTDRDAIRSSTLARWDLILVLAAGALGLFGCGPSLPPRTIYVLGTPAPPVERIEPISARPVIEVKPVLMPDYLDGTDILVRGAGNVMQPSPSGRWGERLSLGATRALAEDLRERLPGYVVTTSAPTAPSSCQLLIDFDSFEQYVNQPVLLIAEWRVLSPASPETLAGERTSITEAVRGSGDSAVVAAMSQALEDLAGRIAAELQPLGPACNRKITPTRS